MRLFWYFLIYSFLGFLLEVVFARVIRSPKRFKKMKPLSCRFSLIQERASSCKDLGM